MVIVEIMFEEECVFTRNIMDKYKMYYDTLSQRLLNLDKKHGSTSFLDFEERHQVKKRLDKIIETNDFSAKNLGLALEEFLLDQFFLSKDNQYEHNEFVKTIIEETDGIFRMNMDIFLDYVYDYTRHLSFPKSIIIEQNEGLFYLSELFLVYLQTLVELEEKIGGNQFYNQYPMKFLQKEEEEQLSRTNEYFIFKKCYKADYIFEMLKLSQEIKGYTTLDHISGVCHIALYIARQLKNAGLPIDLGMVVAASMGHDLGKYGARKGEEKRIPYLHYYYADLWYEGRGMPFAGKVASNHSTWDLELENLQIESLVLIYADFRVKALGKKMHIYNLQDSFQVILDKLDNVDEAKEKRYKRVYSKLKDFEDYMINLGVDTTLDPDRAYEQPKQTQDIALMYGDQIVENIKYQAINYNINILKNFSSLDDFDELLVSLGSEKDWRKLREYITVFQEYYKYIGKKQKLLLLNVLQDLLLFKEEDVRNQSAEIIGIMIANFDEEYRKEIPDDVVVNIDDISSGDLFNRFLTYFLYKDHKQTDKNIEWLRINAKNMVRSIFSTTMRPDQYYGIITNHLERAILNPDSEVTLALTQVLKHIRLSQMKDKRAVYDFLEYYYNDPNVEIRLAVTKLIYILTKIYDAHEEEKLFFYRIVNKTHATDNKVVNYLRVSMLREIQLQCGINVDDKQEDLGSEQLSKKTMGEIYLKNLKSATGWIEKKANIDIMVDNLLAGRTSNNLQTALHFSNLLKVSSTESVRNHSGKSIVKIVDGLLEQEKNEVAIELIRALEMQDIQFTKYIPKYVGQVLTHLEPNEFDEALDDFYVKVKTSTPQLIWLILLAVGYCLEDYIYLDYSKDSKPEEFSNRIEKMLGILMIGLYNADSSISHETLKIISNIFGSDKLSLEQKSNLFRLINKKLLNIIGDDHNNENIYIKNAASLNKIYRFISDYEFFKGPLLGQTTNKVAFFPGTFDPFSLGHKEIAKEIRNLGYDVYLAIDEFSWSKKTQPNEVRRNIIKFSIADEMNIYTFPSQYPINIANDQDIEKLQSLFKGKEISLVVGSDVVENASSYKEGKNGAILDLDHVIFFRKTDLSPNLGEVYLPEHKINNIRGKVTILSLKPQYEAISSTMIRNAVDENRDISELIDYQAQSYIYKFSLYKRAPRFKFFAPKSDIETQLLEGVNPVQAKELLESTHLFDEEFSKEYLTKFFGGDAQRELKFAVTRDLKTDKIIAFSSGFWLKSQDYFKEFKDSNISEFIRNNAVGRIFVINGAWVDTQHSIGNLAQINITEILALALKKDYSYCIYNNTISENELLIQRVLATQGFIKVLPDNIDSNVFAVNMTNPIVLNPDLRSIVKDPFRNNQEIKKVIYETRERLQLALTRLFPGELLLSFDRKTTYSKLVKKVCDLNNVSNVPTNPRVLGEKICVSYGTILNGTIVPNTVTKSLHTEKVFRSDLKRFEIEQYPNYMDLSVQIDYIHSFDRPVILIDDILHKGYRIKKMGPMFSQKNVQVDKLVVAILSGRGQEIMAMQNQEVEHIYYLPNIRNWFNENAMYPFVGGDYVKREGQKESFLVPSLNYILPYAYPAFIKGASRKDVYNLSEVCIENAIMFFEAIEKEYQKINEKNFSLYQLREVFEKTRTPDYGKSMELDLALKPSEYLKNDLEKLRRIKSMFVTKKQI